MTSQKAYKQTWNNVMATFQEAVLLHPTIGDPQDCRGVVIQSEPGAVGLGPTTHATR